MKENNENKKSSKGFFSVLCCCIAIIGTVGYFSSVKTEKYKTSFSDDEIVIPEMETYRKKPENTEKTSPKKIENTIKTEEIKSTSTPQPEETQKTEPEVIENGENTDFYEGETVESVSMLKAPEFVSPLSGDIIRNFSGDELYYNEIFEDFRTHDGIDISASPDAEVQVSLDGTIEDIYESPIGKTVVISHDNGYKTIYSNLDDTSGLEIGTELKKGDFLAHLGTNPSSESDKSSFLHFEIIKNGTNINPSDHISE